MSKREEKPPTGAKPRLDYTGEGEIGKELCKEALQVELFASVNYFQSK